MNEPLLHFKSHIEGKNADVLIHVDRIEWAREGQWGSGGKLALGAMTGGLSLLKTGIRSKQQGSEVIPIKSISSVVTEKDGFRFTSVRIICSGNTIDFRVGHDDAARVKDLITSLMLGSHPLQQASAIASEPTPSVAASPSAAPGDIMGQIRKLGELKDAGLLTEEEFTAKKSELLGRL
jgi:hypothetical protein